MNNSEVLKIASEFNLGSAPTGFSECTDGHINGTFFVDTADGKKYVIQRINTGIFKDPDGLMRNVIGITEHIRRKLAAEGGDVERGTLHFIKTVSGDNYYEDRENGSAWRAYVYVDGVESFQSAGSTDVFSQVGRAFGHFQMQLADYDASGLCETIPNFHNTPSRYADFEAALVRNASGRADRAADAVEFVKAHKDVCSYIADRIAAGVLPLRVTHNDTKLNNVLLDAATRQALCVIDLDTVMPGSSLYDFGDSIRFGAATAAEDEKDISKMEMSLDRFRVFTRGYVRACPGLTAKELELLPMGAKTMTMECGVRFLTDYLDGDHYFAVHRDRQNLDRARTQFKLVADMEKKWDKMRRIVEEEAK